MNRSVIEATEKVFKSFIDHDDIGSRVSYDKCIPCGSQMRMLDATVKVEAAKRQGVRRSQ